MNPTEEEISLQLTRYNFVVKVLDQIIEKIEEKNQADNRWFIFSEKIGKKYLNQSFTLKQLLENDIFLVKNEQETRFIDFSSIYSLLRVQIETYSVFYHLFADKCGMEEKIIRFRLWELDGLRTIEAYEKPSQDDISERLASNKKAIEDCIEIIQNFSYYKKLDSRIQDFLLKYANWKFTSNSLCNKDNRKWKISINQMIMNTGIKESVINDWYSFTSTHTHTSYWSVVQNDTLTLEEKITMKYVAIMQAVYLTSFLIKDFCRIYEVARLEFESLSKHEQEVIDSFNNARQK